MRIALLANLTQNAPDSPALPVDRWAHLDSWQTIEAIIIALEQAGHEVIFLEGDETLYNNLQAVEPDLCFNMCQGRLGRNRTAHVPAILEMLGLPYTGSGPLALSLAQDAALTRRTLAYHGLPVPPFQVFERATEPLNAKLRFPLRVKLSQPSPDRRPEAAVMVSDEPQLRAEVARLLQTATQPVFVEPVPAGREIVVGLVGNLRPPVARRIPQDRNSADILAGLHIFPPLEPTVGPAILTEEQRREVHWLAAAVFRVLGGHDLAQVTVRLEGADPFSLETVELLPRLSPEAELPLAAEAAGWSFETLINRLLLVAIERQPLSRLLAAFPSF